MTHGGYTKCQKESTKKTAKVRTMRSSDWQYLGYVLVGVGGSFAISGAIALYSLQQELLTKNQYSPYFLPILLIGIFIAALGIVAFFQYIRKKKKEIPPPPSPNLPPPPP
ncbi:hypothetical protein MUP42_00340 [Candidatus Bathyarchaeota archaeon]|nr:hypothetical protein [Candidatus Bathyarchaeota archaeon]